MNKRTLGDVTCLTHGNVTAGTIQSLKIDVRLVPYICVLFDRADLPLFQR